MMKRKSTRSSNADRQENRRQFFRQSAQVAAASLFAGAALEDVVERVVHRVGESQAMQRLAGYVAKDLRGLQLQPRAFADECCP